MVGGAIRAATWLPFVGYAFVRFVPRGTAFDPGAVADAGTSRAVVDRGMRLLITLGE